MTEINLQSSKFIGGETISPEGTELKQGQKLLLGDEVYTIHTEEQDDFNKSFIFLSTINETGENDPTYQTYLDGPEDFETGPILSQQFGSVEIIQDEATGVWYPEKPIKVLFWDDLTPGEDRYPMSALPRILTSSQVYENILIAPLSSYEDITKDFGPLDDCVIWAQRRDGNGFNNARDKLIESGFIQNRKIDTYTSKKIITKNYLRSIDLPTPNFLELTKVSDTDDISGRLNDLIASSSEETVYLKDKNNNNGLGIIQIKKKNDSWILLIPDIEDTKKLHQKTIDSSSISIQSIKRNLSSHNYTLEEFNENYFFESGIKRLKVKDEEIEFRLSTLPDGTFEFFARVVPNRENEFRANGSPELVAGKKVNSETIESYLIQKLGEVEGSAMYKEIEKSMSKLVNQITNSTAIEMITENDGISWDVILEDKTFKPQILEVQGLGTTSESFKLKAREIIYNRYREKIKAKLTKIAAQYVH